MVASKQMDDYVARVVEATSTRRDCTRIGSSNVEKNPNSSVLTAPTGQNRNPTSSITLLQNMGYDEWRLREFVTALTFL